ncbi:hypothetical protein D5086_029849 [Populus alba]|uniref:Uncharacterized protein n=1 Tax=Populus alba TaxID=43335 RepID=A0ACC4AVD7_POPAL
MKVSFDIARLRVDVNVSLDVDLSIKNPNKVSVKYKNSSAFLNYRGQVVGEAPIPAGKILADKTQPINVTVTLMADRLLSDSQLLSDVMAGAIPFNTLTKISGKASIFNLFNVHITSTNADIILDCVLCLFMASCTMFIRLSPFLKERVLTNQVNLKHSSGHGNVQSLNGYQNHITSIVISLDDTKIKAVVIIQKPRGSMLLYYSAIAYALHLQTIRRANLSKSYSLRV